MPFLPSSSGLLSYGRVPVGPRAPEYESHTAEQVGPVSAQLSHSPSVASNSLLSGVLPRTPETVCCVPFL